MKPLFLFLVFACSLFTLSARRASMTPVLLAKKYKLVKMWDGNSFLNKFDSRSMITINQETQSIQAFFGCNQMNGPFHTNRYIIEQPIQMTATEMFCTQAINDLEQLFGRGMSQVNHMTIVGNLLRFYQDEQLIFEFQKMVPVSKKKKK